MSTVLQVAEKYIAAGIACHPCYRPDYHIEGKAGKSPKVRNWQLERLSFEAFQKAYKQHDNIGILTGKASGCVVVDIDPRNGGNAWYEVHKDELRGGVIEKTGGGGLHIFFRYPVEAAREGIIGSKTIAPGVDILADGGKQVITWPSVHKTGVIYEWAIEGYDLLDALAEASEPPEWLLDLLPKAEPVPAAAVAATNAAVAATNAVGAELTADIAYVDTLLRNLPPAVAGDSGDHRTFRTACICRDYGLSEETALDLMWRLYNPRCSPPWSFEDLKDKVANAYKYAKGSSGEKSITLGFQAVEPEEAAQDDSPGLTAFLKSPLLAAKRILGGLTGRLRINQEVVYFYDARIVVWRVISDMQFRALIQASIAVLYPVDAESLIKPKNVLEISQSIRYLLEHQGFDATPNRWISDDSKGKNYVRLLNGILNIEQRTFEEHTHEWFSFTKLPYEFNQQAICPQFMSFLSTIWASDSEAIECLQLWFGYLLLSEVREQKFALLIGASRAGKGVLTRLMQKLIGKETTAACTLSNLANDHGLSHLVGKSLAIFGDVVKASGANGEIATERLISIIGQDAQVINPKNAPMFTTILPLKIVMACNELPRFINNRDALSNRMILFPFTESFAGREDPTLEARLEAELPGILNWALEGARRIIGGERLRMPKRAESDFAEVKRQLDPILGFIHECVEFTEHTGFDDGYEYEKCALDDIYGEYAAWCRTNNHSPLSKTHFSARFRTHCPEAVEQKRVQVGSTKINYYHNVRLVHRPLSVGFN